METTPVSGDSSKILSFTAYAREREWVFDKDADQPIDQRVIQERIKEYEEYRGAESARLYPVRETLIKTALSTEVSIIKPVDEIAEEPLAA